MLRLFITSLTSLLFVCAFGSPAAAEELGPAPRVVYWGGAAAPDFFDSCSLEGEYPVEEFVTIAVKAHPGYTIRNMPDLMLPGWMNPEILTDGKRVSDRKIVFRTLLEHGTSLDTSDPQAIMAFPIDTDDPQPWISLRKTCTGPIRWSGDGNVFEKCPRGMDSYFLASIEVEKGERIRWVRGRFILRTTGGYLESYKPNRVGDWRYETVVMADRKDRPYLDDPAFSLWQVVNRTVGSAPVTEVSHQCGNPEY